MCQNSVDWDGGVVGKIQESKTDGLNSFGAIRVDVFDIDLCLQ